MRSRRAIWFAGGVLALGIGLLFIRPIEVLNAAGAVQWLVLVDQSAQDTFQGVRLNWEHVSSGKRASTGAAA